MNWIRMSDRKPTADDADACGAPLANSSTDQDRRRRSALSAGLAG